MRRLVVVVVVLSLFLALQGCKQQQVKESASARREGWSRPVNGLMGRLVVGRTRIRPQESFEAFLELKNLGSVPLTVQSRKQGERLLWNGFKAQILDASGSPAFMWGKGGIYSIGGEWRTIPGDESIRFPVSVRHWGLALKPGKYVLRSTYSSKRFLPLETLPVPHDMEAPFRRGLEGRGENPWEGELVFPEVEIEVLEEENAAGG